MSRFKSLIKETFIYTLGNLGSKLISFFMLPFYTLYLSTEQYGIIDMFTVTASLLIPIISLQISDGVYRELIDTKDNEERKSIISTAINSTLIIFIFIVIILLLSIKENVFNGFSIHYLYFLIASGILYEISKQIVRGLNKTKLYSLSGVLYTGLFVSMNIVLIALLKLGVVGYLISQIISNIVTALIVILNCDFIMYYKLDLNKKKLIRMYRYSIPLLFNALGWWVLNVSDRYIIKYYLGNSAVGIYSFANKISGVMYVFNSIFFLAWQTHSIEESNSNDREEYYSKTFEFFMIFQFIITMLLIISSYPITIIISNKDFITAWRYIPYLSIAVLFNTFSSYYANNYIILKKTGSILYTTIIAALTNITINILLISYIGILAACFSTIISYLVVWIIRIFDKNIGIKIKFEYFRCLINILNCCILAALITINLNITIKIIIIIASTILFILLNYYYLKIIVTKFYKILSNLINR